MNKSTNGKRNLPQILLDEPSTRMILSSLPHTPKADQRERDKGYVLCFLFFFLNYIPEEVTRNVGAHDLCKDKDGFKIKKKNSF